MNPVSQEIVSGQEWASRQAVARLLGVHRSTIIRLEHSPEKHFPRPMKFGKCPLFSVKQVQEWAKAQQEADQQDAVKAPEPKHEAPASVEQALKEVSITLRNIERAEAKTRPVHLVFKPSVYEAFKKKAFQQGETVNGLINRLVEAYIEA